MEKKSLFKVYVKIDALRKKDRKIKRHRDIIAMVETQPTPDMMIELERTAKEYIKTNFKEYHKGFSLEALHFSVDTFEGVEFEQRLLLGDDKDVKHYCLF